MTNLFLRTLSQGLQAFIPIAVAWAWFRPRRRHLSAAIVGGAIVAVPLTIVAAAWFAATTHKALDECLLALATWPAAIAFMVDAWRQASREIESGSPARSPFRRVTPIVVTAVGLAAVLTVVRQSMEIGATFTAAFIDMRSLEATAAVVGGTLLALGLAGMWLVLAARASAERHAIAVRVCAALFVAQVTIYGVHESFEARLWPLREDVSAAIHEATEPYGPDGLYGLHLSELLVILPWCVATLMRVPRTSVVGLVMPVFLAGCGLLSAFQAVSTGMAPLFAAGADVSTVMTRPFVLFRDTTSGPTFGQAAVVPLASPGGERTATGLGCERVSFVPLLSGPPRGLCLHAAPRLFNLFTGYSAVFLDAALRDRNLALTLDGKPSRTRISPDGRLGALTVFVFGDGYTSVDFSTRTWLVDMTTGAKIVDLEAFATSRNGQPIGARDFNFWGVTFARDGDTFYASLRTAGKTALVRGSIAKRTFTVLRDNVECPSLSPDGRRLAFKKFIGPDPGAWRIAVLDLETLQDHLVTGETRYIDDQVEWLDADRILYAVPRRTTSSADVWVATVDGETPAAIFIPFAESPIVVR